METKRYDKLRASFEATQPQVPADFTERVMKRIEGQPQVGQPQRHRWYAAIAAVAASMLLLLALHDNNRVEPKKGSAMELLMAKKPDVQPSPSSERPEVGAVPQTPQTDAQQQQRKKMLPPPLTPRQRGSGRAARHDPQEGVPMPELVAEMPHSPEAPTQDPIEATTIVPPERQALADIYLAEAALQVAYRRQAQAEALRAYAISFEEEEATPAQPIIAF